MSATPEHYAAVAAAFDDTESLSVLTVAGATRDQVVAQLEVDLNTPVDGDWPDAEGTTSWALLEIPGGVLALEITGFGDPSNADLEALSTGGAAAVIRSNILAHYRFGCARAGELVFDDDEYIYIADPDRCPAELRPLFDLVHDDLTDDDTEEDGPSPFTVGLAMAEVVTGLEVTPDHVQAVLESGFFTAPGMRYLGDDSEDDGASGEDQTFEDDEPSNLGVGDFVPPDQIATTDGLYAIGGPFPGTFSDPPADWPADALCVAVDPGTAWVRTLSTEPGARVYPLVVYRSGEPTEEFEELTDAFEHQSSVVLAGIDYLCLYGGPPFQRHLQLTEFPGTYHLRVFAKLPEPGRDYEEHVLVVWPAPDAQPDVPLLE